MATYKLKYTGEEIDNRLKAIDQLTNYVDLTSNQTITGTKTFIEDINLVSGSSYQGSSKLNFVGESGGVSLEYDNINKSLVYKNTNNMHLYLPNSSGTLATESYVRNWSVWRANGSPLTYTITSTTGISWRCESLYLINRTTNKWKIEYTLYSLTEETLIKEPIAFSTGDATQTIGAKYRTGAIAYTDLPQFKNDTNTYWVFDHITWDEQSNIETQCTPLPFRNNEGFETRILVLDENPPEQITFKTIMISATLYEK